MSSDFQKVKLKNISIGKGSYGIGAPAVERSNELPTYLRITDIDDFGNIDFSNLKSVDNINSKKYFLKENDIIFARTGASTGRAYFYEKKHGKFVYAGFLIKFSLNPDLVNPQFMKYYTLSDTYINWVKAFTGGSTRGNINAKTYGDMEVLLPSIEQQNLLVRVLSSIDDKMEVNNKINKNLEDIAQALYKQWFVDFEFPNENGEPYKSSGGEMIESDLGLIPLGWKFKPLESLATISRGLSYKGKYLSEQGVKMINLGNVQPMGGFRYDKLKYYTGEFKDIHIVKPGDLIIANTDMTANREILGTPIMVPEHFNKKNIFTHHLYAIKDLKISKYYLYYYFLSDIFKKMAENYANGTTVLSISKRDIEQVPVIVGGENIIDKFAQISKIIKLLIGNNHQQNKRLSELRDTLLPKLMSGEIEVSSKE